jgi:hypothetical protein
MIDFPASPSIGQIFTSAGVSWKWNGTKWTTYFTGSASLIAAAVVPLVTAAFTTPGIGGTVVVSVNDTTWLVVNAQLFIVDAYYNINSIAGLNLTLQRTA